MRHQLIQWLFIALLLVSQAVLTAHGIDSDAHAGDEETCTVCVLASGLDHSPTTEFLFRVLPVECQSAVFPVFTRPGQAINALYRARAPPVTHSNIS